MLGITYYGIGDFENSLEKFDKVIEKIMDNGKKNILLVPKNIIVLKIRSLINLNRFEKANAVYSTYWAFFNKKAQEDIENYINQKQKIHFTLKTVDYCVNELNISISKKLFIPILPVEKKNLINDSDIGKFLKVSEYKDSVAVQVLNENPDNGRTIVCYWKKNVLIAIYNQKSTLDFRMENIINLNHSYNETKMRMNKFKFVPVMLESDKGNRVIAFSIYSIADQ